MANSPLWQLICVQILFAQLMYFAVSGTDQDNKNVPAERKRVIRGTFESNQNCSEINGKKKRTKACGRPYGDPSVLKQKRVVCESFFKEDYPCCPMIPAAPKTMKLDLEDSLGNSKTKCSDIYMNPGNIKNPYTVTVSWKMNSIGSFGTWGWKVKVLGLDGNANYRQCHLVISKDKELNTTISNLMLGARYNITIQTLPESRKKPNFLHKTIPIPHLLDMCNADRNCNWEFCFPVEDVKVTNYSTSPIVSWNSSPFYKSQHVFEVIYHDEERTDNNEFIVENGTSFNLTTLQHKYGRKYFVKVRPIFLHPTIEPGDSPRGKESNEVIFYTAELPTVPPPPVSHNLKIIISVSVVTVCLFIVFLWMVHRKCQSTKGKPEGSDSRETLIKPNSDVLLVHDGHCESCNHATHLLASILCETGHIDCFLDLCSTKEIAINGLHWYEEKLKTCGKIVVICTKESKNTYYNGDGENNNFYQNAFRMVLRMILGEMANKSGSNSDTATAAQIFPVCFDYSSNDDIPNFLRDKQYFSLPSRIEDLLFSLSDLNPRTIGVMGELAFQNSKLQQMIHKWEHAIRSVEKKHCNNGSGSLINYARSLSCTSSNEATRV